MVGFSGESDATGVTFTGGLGGGETAESAAVRASADGFAAAPPVRMGSRFFFGGGFFVSTVEGAAGGGIGDFSSELLVLSRLLRGGMFTFGLDIPGSSSLDSESDDMETRFYGQVNDLFQQSIIKTP